MGLFGPATTLVVADQPAVSQSGPTEDVQLPIYTPPKKLTQRARVGGELRGTEGKDPEVQAIVPDHVALTVKKNPALNWYLSKPTTDEIWFTLVDSRFIKPLHEGPIPSPKKEGIYTIDLKDFGLDLDPEVQYRWYVSLIRDANSHAPDIIVGGIIERCEFNACLIVGSPDLTCNQQSVYTNARGGFWYDAMSCLCTLIETKPIDASLRRLRAQLLKEIGLHGVAEWDLRSIQAPAR
jgi:hypothetical protein